MSNQAKLDQLLYDSLEDGRLTRSEKRELKDVLADMALDADDLARFRNKAFKIARSSLDGMEPAEVLDWIEGVVKVMANVGRGQSGAHRPASVAEAYFSPGDACRMAIAQQLKDAKSSADICVFTITDDRITQAIVGAKDRGVRVRVISDNDKAHDLGSDIDKLERQGVDVRVDRTDAHMHHKYAVFDRKTLLTGSYNWTRSASTKNNENVVVTNDTRLVTSFTRAFDKLWDRLG